MIKNFEMIGYISRPQWRPFGVGVPNPATSEEALEIARKCVEEETEHVLSVMFSYRENDLGFVLNTNAIADDEEIHIKGRIGLPEIILADLPGRMLSELIQSSRILDAVMGNRVIIECSYSPESSSLTVVVEGAGRGWWFNR